MITILNKYYWKLGGLYSDLTPAYERNIDANVDVLFKTRKAMINHLESLKTVQVNSVSERPEYMELTRNKTTLI